MFKQLENIILLRLILQIYNWNFYFLFLFNYSYVIIGDQDGNKGQIPEFNIEIDEPDDESSPPSDKKRAPGLKLGTKERLEAFVVAVIENENSISFTNASCQAWFLAYIYNL